MQGTINRLVSDRGFGFILGPNGDEYFFHRSGLKDVEFTELTRGAPVWFDISEESGSKPGAHLRAVNVTTTEQAVPGVDDEPLPPGQAAGHD